MPNDIGPQAILVVEEEANTLNIIRDYMSRAGFQVRTAGNGWEALKRVKDGPVDLVISELEIGDMDGSGLRERLLLNPSTREIPFLCLVPQDKTDVLVKALRSGVDDCITKPFDPVVLVARVQAALERRRTYENMVRIDPLTRLLNRPTFEKEIAEELKRVERYKRIASFVLVDIDDFSEVNTENGVALGDLLLTCLAGVILSSIRSLDLAGRVHGGKFVLCLPETDGPGAETLTRRMQAQLGSIADTVANFTITFSCGIVSAPEDGISWEDLHTRLQETVQAAKAQGKGKIVVRDRDAS
jgi:diguanylate cyclase (GGDEF)-like protein